MRQAVVAIAFQGKVVLFNQKSYALSGGRYILVSK